MLSFIVHIFLMKNWEFSGNYNQAYQLNNFIRLSIMLKYVWLHVDSADIYKHLHGYDDKN